MEQANSQHVTAPLVLRISEQDEKMSYIHEQLNISRKKRTTTSTNISKKQPCNLKSELPPALQRSAELATEDGASSWLTGIF